MIRTPLFKWSEFLKWIGIVIAIFWVGIFVIAIISASKIPTYAASAALTSWDFIKSILPYLAGGIFGLLFCLLATSIVKSATSDQFNELKNELKKIQDEISRIRRNQ